jgi:hypothetical protein
MSDEPAGPNVQGGGWNSFGSAVRGRQPQAQHEPSARRGVADSNRYHVFVLVGRKQLTARNRDFLLI